MSEHTPGPWRISKGDWTTVPWRDAIIIEGDIEGGWAAPPEICALYRGTEQEADARLIVAAPQMLEALKRVDELLGKMNTSEVDISLEIHGARVIVGAAIAKATTP